MLGLPHGSLIVFLYALGVCVALPAAMIWGWVRWAKRAKQSTLPAILSFAGFVLASASALLAISAALYAGVISGFPLYDSRLLTIYRWGFLLSLGAIVFAISGIWRQSPLRWHAPACSFGTLLFWVVSASGE